MNFYFIVCPTVGIAVLVTLIIDRLRQQSFPYLLHILRNPVASLISLNPHTNNGEGTGFLYLFDNKTTNYLEDNIQWASKRMNIKLVLYNQAKNTYKLKNHKEDVGECVMRRQTWTGVSDVVVWRRSEYKLMNKVVCYTHKILIKIKSNKLISKLEKQENAEVLISTLEG